VRAGEGISVDASSTYLHQYSGRDLHVHYGQGVRRALSSRPAAHAPYPGLAAFTADQQDIFFGRERQVADVVKLIDEHAEHGGIHFLIAASGAGKTSLLHAGVIPKIQQGVIPGSADWPVVSLTPTDDPHRELSERLREVGTEGPTLVVIDQFEELYTQCPDARRREDFIQLLSEISSGGERPRCLVLAAVRSDFFEDCARSATLRESLQRRALVLGPMTVGEVRTAITAPAEQFGLTLEPGLVEVLIRDLGFSSDAPTTDGEAETAAAKLPLLAHALRATWRQRHGDTLTVAGYVESGGLNRAIATSAEKIYASLPGDGKRVARALFIRLTWIGDGFEVARQRVSAAELHEAIGSPRLSDVVEQFTTLRLLARDRDHVEITHEALLQAWPRLRSWLDDDRAGNITRQEVEQAASEWVGSQRDPDLLYRGLRLEAAKSWRSTSVSDIGSDVRHFIDTSAAHAARRQRIRQAVLALLVTLTLVAVTGGAVALQQAQIASEQAYIAREQERLAFTSAISANADRLRNDDISTAAQLDLRAHGMQPDGTTYANLVESGNATLSHPLEGHAADVLSVAYSPDGRTLVTGGADQSVRFWTLGGAAGPVLAGMVATARPVLTVAFGSAGKSVVVGESGGGIEVFSLRDRTRIGPVLQAHAGNVNALTYSEQTGILASAGDDERIRFWSSNQDLSLEPTGRDIASSGTEVLALDFDGFGSALVAGGADGSTTTWDVRNINGPYRLATMNHHEDRVTAVDFSADGRLLATGSWDDTVQVVDSQDKTTLKIESDYLEPGVSSVTSVAFSPTGTTLAVAGYSGEIVMYSLADPATPRVQWMPLRGHLGDVGTIAFSPDGSTLASGGRDHIARIWQLQTNFLAVSGQVQRVDYLAGSDRIAVSTAADIQILQVPREGAAQRLHQTLTSPYPGQLGAFALSEDSTWIAAGDENGVVHLWKTGATEFEYISSIQTDVGWITTMEIDHNSAVLAIGGTTGVIKLLNLRVPTPQAYPATLTGHEGDVASLTFSRDSRTLLSAGTDTDIRVWNVANPATTSQISHRRNAHTDLATTVKYSPDGLTIATASYDNTARLWRLVDGSDLQPTSRSLNEASGFVTTVAWAENGALLATGSWDGQVRLYSVSESGDAATSGNSLSNQWSAVNVLDFSPDEKTLAVGGTNGIVLFLSLDKDVLRDRICKSSRLTIEEWRDAMRSGVEFVEAC
jgi:WD40 repeat protein